VPAVAVVLGMRQLVGEEQTLLAALAMLALYVVTTLAATGLLERQLLREILAYVRRRSPADAPA
jgi:hypothetical protein